ncbi:hypothetical protein PR048_008363, partial [Dryococelus australis]
MCSVLFFSMTDICIAMANVQNSPSCQVAAVHSVSPGATLATGFCRVRTTLSKQQLTLQHFTTRHWMRCSCSRSLVCCSQLKDAERKILQVLSSHDGDILEDEVAVQVVVSCRTLSAEVMEKEEASEEAEKIVDETRDEYRSIAEQAVILFSTIGELVTINPMYQYSLTWFINLFKASFDNTEKVDDLQLRLADVARHFNYSLYVCISRSIFHKVTLKLVEAAVAQRLEHSPVTKVNLVRFPTVSLPNYRPCKWCRTIALVGGFFRGSPVSLAHAFRGLSILTSLHPHRLSRPRCQQPPKSLHSTVTSPLDYYLLGHIKAIVYAIPVTNMQCFANEWDKISSGYVQLLEYFNVYDNQRRGMFSHAFMHKVDILSPSCTDKLLFSVLLAVNVLKSKGLIDQPEWIFFLTGGGGDEDGDSKLEWLPNTAWNQLRQLNDLQHFQGKTELWVVIPDIRLGRNRSSQPLSHQHELTHEPSVRHHLSPGLLEHVEGNSEQWRAVHDSSDPHACSLPQPWDSSLSLFRKTLVVRCLRPNTIISGLANFIAGKFLTLPPPSSGETPDPRSTQLDNRRASTHCGPLIEPRTRRASSHVGRDTKGELGKEYSVAPVSDVASCVAEYSSCTPLMLVLPERSAADPTPLVLKMADEQ